METVSVAAQSADTMDMYHEYLTSNYEGGCDRFFSPTGFLKKFQRSVEVESQVARNHVFAKSVDDAQRKLEPAVMGGEGVFDLTAEPGTGKTSVLPFRFPSKRVVVALPTPFDAWNAFNVATGECRLYLQGLVLGSNTNVTYTDSYMATRALLSNYLEYDIMIVDECDSDRGVSPFLAEVKTPGKLLIRMSASHGATQSGPSRSFKITEATDMPDVRQSVTDVVKYVGDKHFRRSLVLAPDADTAEEIAAGLLDAKLVTVRTNLGDIARSMTDQSGSSLYVSDETCGRSLNMNLDCVFDCQLVTEYSNVRALTPAELYQRKGRVGRVREGWYFSPGLAVKERKSSEFDIVRHNVVRAISGIPQLGEERLKFDPSDAVDFMCSPREPYEMKAMALARETAVVSPSSSSSSSRSRKYSTPTPSVRRDEDEYSQVRVTPPSWLCYFGGLSSGASDVGKGKISGGFIVSNSRGRKMMARKSSSSSGEESGFYNYSTSVRSGTESRGSLVRSRAAPMLPVATGAPYAVARKEQAPAYGQVAIPNSPPLMDLDEATYDVDWPALIRDRLMRGGDLPTLVPPGSWRHTSSGGMGTDWFRRLEEVSYRDNSFDDQEFEVVCRAWNRLVAQAWIRPTPGLSNAADEHRLEFCLRYFQSYFLLGSAS